MDHILVHFFDHRGNSTTVETRECFFKQEIIPKMDQSKILYTTTQQGGASGYNVISQQIPTDLIDSIVTDNILQIGVT